MIKCDEVAEKLSGFIDRELTQQQAQEIGLHIDNCDGCGKLHSDLLNLQTDIKKIHIEGGDEVLLEKILQDPGAQQTQQWGWMLFIIGSSIMVVYAIYEFLINTELTSFEKMAIGFLGIGGLLLLISVIRQRLIASKTDKYKDINI